jgi:uncharacterized Zn finger protein
MAKNAPRVLDGGKVKKKSTAPPPVSNLKGKLTAPKPQPLVSRYYSHFAPYVSVAQRRINAQKELQKLQKKGRVIEPLGELSHRTKIATSFWGQAWCKNLESFSDYENRLPRGRTYVRNGSVLHLSITPGRIEALVQGSSLYEQTITISPLPAATWKTLQSRSQGKIGSLIELLQGKVSDEIMAIVTHKDGGLFPKPKEIKLSCSCPDYAGLCKHLAAVLYGIGARLDSRPELLFKLRGVDHNDLISAVDPAIALGSPSKASGRRRTLDSAALGDVFGIDLEADPAPAASKAKSKSAPKVKKTVVKKPRPFKATSASIRKLRSRLGLTRPAFAAKLGVSVQSIVNWETKGGALKLQAASLARLQALASETAPDA